MEYLYVEKTELIYTDVSRPNPPTINIPYSTISTVFYGIRTKKLLFGLLKLPEKYLSINSSMGVYSITEKAAGKDDFERYIKELGEFTHRHHVTMRETTGDDKEDWRL
ncbi:MAG: hypothetical protein IKV54_02560 [Clostridia bacterium]|nr:hypothetical protein [Clostridia bacterium]